MDSSVVRIHHSLKPHRTDAAAAHSLSEREELILRAIVQSYVSSANPVSSAALMKQLESDLKVSSATIRNVMAHLEEQGYINHPHVSAGRVPTDLGYRYYVDSLMAPESLTTSEAKALQTNLSSGTTENLLRDASRLLGVVSRLLGVVQLPTVGDLTIPYRTCGTVFHAVALESLVKSEVPFSTLVINFFTALEAILNTEETLRLSS